MKLIADRRTCKACRVHRALFFTRQGRIRWDREHVLCTRCFRSMRDQVRVMRAAVTAVWTTGVAA